MMNNATKSKRVVLEHKQKAETVASQVHSHGQGLSGGLVVLEEGNNDTCSWWLSKDFVTTNTNVKKSDVPTIDWHRRKRFVRRPTGVVTRSSQGMVSYE